MMVLSHLDDLDSICRRIKKLANTLPYVIFSYLYILNKLTTRRITLVYVVIRWGRRKIMAYTL